MNFRKKTVALLSVALFAGNLLAEDLSGLIPGLYQEFHPSSSGIFVGSTDGHRAHFLTGTDAALRSLNQQLGRDFAVFPFSSTAGAFNFTYDPDLATFVRTTDTLGPLFAERADVLGAHNLNVAFAFTFFNYDSFNGHSLDSFHVTATHSPATLPPPDEINPGTFEEDTLDIKLKVDASVKIYSFIANYGISDSLDVGVLIPLVDVGLRVKSHWSLVVSPNNTNTPGVHHSTDPAQGADPQNDRASGSAFGLGDLVLRSKYQLLRDKPADIAALVLVQLPTGDENNFLGSGDTTVRPVLVASKTFRDVFKQPLSFTPHLNLGYEFDLDDHRRSSFEYAAGAEAGIKRVTVDLDFLGSFRDHDDQHRLAAAVGAKWNVWKNLILSANFLLPLNDEGLRSDLITTVGAEYSFKF